MVLSLSRYHAIIKQLKALIRKARSFQPVRLLDKHCVTTSFCQNTGECSALVTEVSTQCDVLWFGCSECGIDLYKSV